MIRTQYYGLLEIRYDRTYANTLVDIIEDSEGNNYEIAINFNGKMQAYLLKDEE